MEDKAEGHSPTTPCIPSEEDEDQRRSQVSNYPDLLDCDNSLQGQGDCAATAALTKEGKENEGTPNESLVMSPTPTAFATNSNDSIVENEDEDETQVKKKTKEKSKVKSKKVKKSKSQVETENSKESSKTSPPSGKTNDNVVDGEQVKKSKSVKNPGQSKTKKRISESKGVQEKAKRPDREFYVPPPAKPSHADNATTNAQRGKVPSSSNEAHSNPSPVNHPPTNCTSPTSDSDESESWDNMFDENGDCLKPELMDRIKDALSISKGEEIELKRPTHDYDAFQPPPESHEIDDHSKFSHILEAYDFAPELKTQDIITSLHVYNHRDFDIKWVDETHALVVFSSHGAAASALEFAYHNIKLRPLNKGTRESKMKAKRCAEYVLPYKERPKTSAICARRLVTSHLGIKGCLSPEQRSKERQQLIQAKESQRRAKQQSHEIWNGTPA